MASMMETLLDPKEVKGMTEINGKRFKIEVKHQAVL